jgi:macrolide-specific efflux system membrane fusion protein
MYVQLGDQVKQGQLIAQIDSTTQENSLKTSDANIKNLEAQRLQQVASLNESNSNIVVNNKCMLKMQRLVQI